MILWDVRISCIVQSIIPRVEEKRRTEVCEDTIIPQLAFGTSKANRFHKQLSTLDVGNEGNREVYGSTAHHISAAHEVGGSAELVFGR